MSEGVPDLSSKLRRIRDWLQFVVSEQPSQQVPWLVTRFSSLSFGIYYQHIVVVALSTRFLIPAMIAAMFGLEDAMCYSRAYEEEECLSSGWFCSPIDTSMYWDLPVIDGWESASELALREEQNKSTGGYQCRWQECADMRSSTITGRLSDVKAHLREWHAIGASLQVQFSILDDWATALHAYHVNDVVCGNLTPESVGVLIHGRGTLGRPTLLQNDHSLCSREPPDDDVYGARWAATELFRIDNGNPSPTKMSDVYSFACLMLQMLTGEVPYCGTKRSEQVVYLKYLGREPIDAQTPKVEDRHAAFMRWCWSPEPEKRPTMEAVVDFIHEELKRLGEQHG